MLLKHKGTSGARNSKGTHFKVYGFHRASVKKYSGVKSPLPAYMLAKGYLVTYTTGSIVTFAKEYFSVEKLINIQGAAKRCDLLMETLSLTQHELEGKRKS